MQEKLPILFEKKVDCCGCTTCYAICPVRAISMKFDVEGFLYPVVDDGKCTRCYRCLKVCSFKEERRKRS